MKVLDSTFSPYQLFARGRQGAWFEPRQGSMWQENTGVTPTTSGGQTIGKLVDLSADRVASQATAANRPMFGTRWNLLIRTEDYSNSAWVKQNGTSVDVNAAAAPDGTLSAVRVNIQNKNSDYFYQSINVSAGLYVVSFWARVESGTATFTIGNTSAGTLTLTTAWTYYTAQFTHAGGANNVYPVVLNANVSFLLWHPDFRLSAAAAKDPAYQRVTTATDYDAGRFPAIRHADSTDFLTVSLPAINVRRNLLTYSEQFDSVAWNKQGIAVVTKNTTLAPNGVSAASTVTLPGYTGSYLFTVVAVSAVTYTLSIYVKSLSGTMTNVTLNLYNGINNQASNPFTVTTEWQRITWTFTIANAGTVNFYTPQLTGAGGSIYIWGAQLELGSVATDYQKITDWTSEQYSSAGSVYFATPQGMSCLHNQSIGTSYNQPALQTDIYGTVITPARLTPPEEQQLENYFLAMAGISGSPDWLLDDTGIQVTDDAGELLLTG